MGVASRITWAVVLGPEQIEWMRHGASTVTLGARDEACRPSLGQALACRVDEAGRVTLFLVEARNVRLLADIAQNGALSVVFTESFSTRSLQVKGSDAHEVALLAGDDDLITENIERVVAVFRERGTPESFTRALLAREPGRIVALCFMPEAAFDQTPGPRAGNALGAADGSERGPS